ncbi:hypothetical protein M0R45_008091 [Rubus argutus]|uniref:Uncharacterized protein n=1 Tax=Rubus argutus TaxID=59490 RepID=A0AAW1Y0P0_RUBAR
MSGGAGLEVGEVMDAHGRLEAGGRNAGWVLMASEERGDRSWLGLSNGGDGKGTGPWFGVGDGRGMNSEWVRNELLAG